MVTTAHIWIAHPLDAMWSFALEVTQPADETSTSNLRPMPFSGLLPSWSLFRRACDVDLTQVAQPTPHLACRD